jgi:hypothetical protein
MNNPNPQEPNAPAAFQVHAKHASTAATAHPPATAPVAYGSDAHPACSGLKAAPQRDREPAAARGTGTRAQRDDAPSGRQPE